MREIQWSFASCMPSPGYEDGHMSWPGIESVTFHCKGRCPNSWAILARAGYILILLFIIYLFFIPRTLKILLAPSMFTSYHFVISLPFLALNAVTDFPLFTINYIFYDFICTVSCVLFNKYWFSSYYTVILRLNPNAYLNS